MVPLDKTVSAFPFTVLQSYQRSLHTPSGRLACLNLIDVGIRFLPFHSFDTKKKGRIEEEKNKTK